MDVLDHGRLERRRSRSFAIAAALIALFLASAGSAYEDEDELTAAFVYRLASMTRWTEAELDRWPPVVCIAVVGDEAVADALTDVIRSKQLHGHHVDVHTRAGVNDNSDCVVAYLRGPLAIDILAATASSPTLTVGVADDFLERGGSIQLIPEPRRLRFRINRTAMAKQGLTMSSKVLRLAVSVE